jgi:hypothetical protein
MPGATPNASAGAEKARTEGLGSTPDYGRRGAFFQPGDALAVPGKRMFNVFETSLYRIQAVLDGIEVP